MTKVQSYAKITPTETNIRMDPRLELVSLRQQLKDKEIELLRERNLRLAAEKKLYEFIEDRDRNWQRKLSTEERKALKAKRAAECAERQLTGRKSDGRPIATPADGLTSRTEIETFLAHLKTHGRLGVRNWAMFRIGLATGLRISDVIRFKWCWVLNPDGTWRDCVKVVEQKTSKINHILITDVIKETLIEYRDWLGAWKLEDNIFCKTNGAPLTKQHASDIIADANKVAQIEKHISSHTMRKTFANIIVATYDGSYEIESVERVRSLLNHTSLSSTNHYLGLIKQKDDEARETVSDFLLGKLDIETLEVPKSKTNNEIYDLLVQIQEGLHHVDI